MSLRFCSCGGLLEELADESLEFVCVACGNRKSVRDTDTMLHEEIFGGSVSNFDTLIRTAPFDSMNPIKKIYCDQCKSDTWHNWIYLGEEMTIVHSCLDCHKQTSG